MNTPRIPAISSFPVAAIALCAAVAAACAPLYPDDLTASAGTSRAALGSLSWYIAGGHTSAASSTT